MRRLILLLLLLVVGCKQVFDMEGFTPDPNAAPTWPEEPWTEKVIGTTRAGTIVAVTRDSPGFPDSSFEFRLYLRGELFAQGVLAHHEWEYAMSHDPSTNTYVFALVTERCIVDDNGARCTRPRGVVR